MQEHILTAVQQLLPQWKDIQQSQVTVLRMIGITNLTFKVGHNKPNIQPKTIIYRQFGKSCNQTLLNRQIEKKAYKVLAQKKIGPIVYNWNQRGRAEFYFESRCLLQEEMMDHNYFKTIAQLLRNFHSIDLDIEKQNIILKILKENQIQKQVKQKIQTLQLNPEEQKMVQQVSQWWTLQEKTFLLKLIQTIAHSNVFSHNDLLSNNILILKQGGFKLIDFQYSNYNFKGYDLANYLNQSQYFYGHTQPPYFTVNQEMVSNQKILEFIKIYLQNKEDQDFVREVKICMLLSHYYWGMWALIMSKNPDIKFDYIRFSHSRFQKYKIIKQNII